MNARGVAGRYPVLLGGAALTRSYVENDLVRGLPRRRPLRQGRVRGPAADGPGDVGQARARPGRRQGRAAKVAERRERHHRSRPDRRGPPVDGSRGQPSRSPARSAVAIDNPIPTPPFWGSRVVKGIPLADYAALLDERAMFLGQWGLRGARGGNGPSYEELVETEGRPRLRVSARPAAHRPRAVGRGDVRVLPVRVRGRLPGGARRAARPTRRRLPGSPSRGSAGTSTSAWRITSVHGQPARSTWSPSSSSPWASGSPTWQESCSRPTPIVSTSSCTGSRCS